MKIISDPFNYLLSAWWGLMSRRCRWCSPTLVSIGGDNRHPQGSTVLKNCFNIWIRFHILQHCFHFGQFRWYKLQTVVYFPLITVTHPLSTAKFSTCSTRDGQCTQSRCTKRTVSFESLLKPMKSIIRCLRKVGAPHWRHSSMLEEPSEFLSSKPRS